MFHTNQHASPSFSPGNLLSSQSCVLGTCLLLAACAVNADWAHAAAAACVQAAAVTPGAPVCPCALLSLQLERSCSSRSGSTSSSGARAAVGVDGQQAGVWPSVAAVGRGAEPGTGLAPSAGSSRWRSRKVWHGLPAAAAVAAGDARPQGGWLA